MSNNEKYYKVYNILKKLGFKSNLYGTKLLIEVILKASAFDDYYNINDIYSIVSKEINKVEDKPSKKISQSEIKSLIFYSINNRKKDISKKNFENIFGFEYDEYYFTVKELVELFCVLLKIK